MLCVFLFKPIATFIYLLSLLPLSFFSHSPSLLFFIFSPYYLFYRPLSLSFSPLSPSNGNYIPNPGSAFRPIDPADGGSGSLKSPSYAGSLTDVIIEVTRQLHKFDLSYDVW